MAYCVLCGKKVGLLDQIDLDFHGSKQVLCSACDVRMNKASPGERQDLEQQILASPHLQKADTVQANVNTGKVCPACGAILERKLEHFSIGADGGGGLMTLLADQYDVDLYACPQCGKVELYTAGFVPPSSTQNSELKEQASQAAPETIPAQSDEKRSFRFPWQKEEKAPWEK